MERGQTQEPVRPRRSQEERTSEMRGRLIAATLDMVLADGFHRLSTPRICEAAGVSRGAMLHHFPDKRSLIVAAIEDLLITSTQEIRSQADRVRAREITPGEFVDHLWYEHFSGRLFYLTLEHVTTSRTDAAVRAALIPVVRRFHRALNEIWEELFVGEALPTGRVATVLNLTLCLLRGMGLQTVLRPDDDAYYDDLRGAWKTILAAILAGTIDLDEPDGVHPPSRAKEKRHVAVR
jgi:AcrR family transcriptional regulator